MRIHFRAPGRVAPQGHCGKGWFFRVTRRIERVTCRQCRTSVLLAHSLRRVA